MRKLFITFIILVSISGFCQNSKMTILCVAAHPDDEDGATLAYYSKLMGYNAYTVFYTRGEGGQNEIGPELYDELGKIREQECYQAAEIQGSKAYFLGCLDFGFSKTAKETFKFWGGEDSVLSKIVYLIRLIRPDVVITNHDTITVKPNRQHGNHQVVGITIYKAFEKAADPLYHSEQLINGISTWQIKKLFFRVYDTTKTDGVVNIDISKKNETGRTIEDISFEALSKHKTQGMDKISRIEMGVFGKRNYLLVRSDKNYTFNEKDLFSGIELSEKKETNTDIKSYPTKYSYKTVNPYDSSSSFEYLRFNHFSKIGLVKSYDNTIEKILKAFQVEFDTLSKIDLMNKDLSNYTTIILDIRAYLYRNDLIANNSRILKYIENGGNILCFYNKPQDWNGKNYSPYPIFLTSERVTEEDSKINILQNNHRILNEPNEITYGDFSGWVQERNVYLPSDDTLKTSSKYLKLLEMNDENDTVPSTSLLCSRYGTGTYTYCSLAIYRQLKIFHYGALKLFLNMISQPRNNE
jgi:LmbE family N-acetylglucosaminyl deacetylase